MTILEKLKKNAFLSLVVLAYVFMFIFKWQMGIESVKNSLYYIKEMLLIMPVIFVLTALLDLWVPKEKIIRYLGKEAGAKGTVLSFVIGSVSAGPIYAAFPMCVMLHKKGASIKNIVIILSSWAVIKIPMLLNEAKFLGFKFMAIRWVLTVGAVVVFSWITSRIIKDEDLPVESKVALGLSINEDACMGCGICAEEQPELFEMDGRKARVKVYNDENIDRERLNKTMELCPVESIKYVED
ncbi:MAG: permease [Clostridiales bacterium]|nr:permease [Clostridiales bacterium]